MLHIRVSSVAGATAALAVFLVGPGLRCVTPQEPFPSGGEAARRHIEAAKQAQGAHNLAKAVEEYKKALALAPRSAEIYQNLGLVYHLQNKYRAAIPAFEKAVALQPDLWASHLFLGMDYFKTNQFSRAVPLLRKALELGPKEAEVEGRYWLGITYMALEKYPEAIRELERRFELPPHDIEVLYSLAQAHSSYAAQLSDRLLSGYPESARALEVQGDQAQAAEKLEEAVKAYSAAAARQPNLPGVYLSLGDLYQQMRDPARAAECFETELRLNPYDTRAREQLARARRDLGVSTAVAPEPTEQKESIEASAPTAAETRNERLFLRGVGHFHAGQWKEAVDAFQGIVNIDAQPKAARLYLARCLIRVDEKPLSAKRWRDLLDTDAPDAESLYALGDIQGYLASAALEKLMATEPQSYRVYRMRGENYEREGRYSKALEAYQNAFAIKPDLPGLRFAIGSICWKTHQLDQAAKWLKDELKTNPHHALANYELGNIYMYGNQHSQAVVSFREALSGRPNLIQAHRDLATALIQLQQYGEAIEHLRLVAQADPEDDSVHALLARVYHKEGKLDEERAELMLCEQLNRRKHERVRHKFSELNELIDSYKPKEKSQRETGQDEGK